MVPSEELHAACCSLEYVSPMPPAIEQGHEHHHLSTGPLTLDLVFWGVIFTFGQPEKLQGVHCGGYCSLGLIETASGFILLTNQTLVQATLHTH